MNIGFVKYNRTDASKNLHARPIENHVLNVIASRVSRAGNPVKGVKIGEAIVSDFKNFGLKRQPLRTALNNLRKWGYITTRATNKTTYATLVDTEVYDCNLNQPNQQNEPQVTNKLTSEQPTSKQTANHYQEVKNKEDKKKERKDIVDVIDVCTFFQSETGKSLKIPSSDSNIKRSDKYKRINARLQEGATVEDCKAVIRLKNKQWENKPDMKKYIQISTLFAKANFEKYLDEVLNESGSTAPKTFSYELPEFETPEERQLYFYTKYLKYTESGILDNRLINTEYRKRALLEKDAEGLCHKLEQEKPELLKL